MAGATSTLKDAKYCYISTTTSQSSSSSNYQNIPYRMPTTTPVIYQGSSTNPLNYMPIAIWSTLPVFNTSVYYNNGTSTVTYPTDGRSLLNMNQTSGPAMLGNGAGKSYPHDGSKATPFFGRYQETSGEIHDNWQVYTGYLSSDGTVYQYPPAAPIYAAADYKMFDSTYTGTVTVTVYNYAEYSARGYIRLYAGSTSKYTSGTVSVSAMTISSNKLSPGSKLFSASLGSAAAVRAITSIKVYWYSHNSGNLTIYSYPVSFTMTSTGGGTTCIKCNGNNNKINLCHGVDSA